MDKTIKNLKENCIALFAQLDELEHTQSAMSHALSVEQRNLLITCIDERIKHWHRICEEMPHHDIFIASADECGKLEELKSIITNI